MMIADGILIKRPVEDARKSGLHLGPKGRSMLKKLQPNWDVTFEAISALEADIGHPLRQVLEATAKAEGFAQRLKRAATEAYFKVAVHGR